MLFVHIMGCDVCVAREGVGGIIETVGWTAEAGVDSRACAACAGGMVLCVMNRGGIESAGVAVGREV